jgi:uncharacterized protein (DUF1697 family)
MIALLRGINVGGNKLVPMGELRKLAIGLRFGNVATYIQSGNLVFTTTLAAATAEAALEKAIAAHFGFCVDVVVRSGRAWLRYAAKSPFADAEEARPNLLLLGLAKRPLKPRAAEALRPFTTAGERIEAVRDALWIDYGASIGRSKLSPVVLDRAVGSTVTARNWRTVQKLAELVRALDS